MNRRSSKLWSFTGRSFMLLSEKYNFIFLHVPKVAGQSISNALIPFTASPVSCALSRVVGFREQLKLMTFARKHVGIASRLQPFDDHIRL